MVAFVLILLGAIVESYNNSNYWITRLYRFLERVDWVKLALPYTIVMSLTGVGNNVPVVSRFMQEDILPG